MQVELPYLNKNNDQKLAQQYYIPICYGSISFYQGKKADEKHTHKWCTFLRGANNEDLSSFISKVVFVLHPSFDPPSITVEQHPFQVIQSGWGEFEIKMELHFKQEFNIPLEIYHKLKLYHTHGNQSQSTKKPVISEFYEEIVFVNPSNSFKQLLDKVVPLGVNNQNGLTYQASNEDGNILKEEKEEEALNDFHNYFTKFDPTQDEQKLRDALKIVQMEVHKLSKEAQKVEEDINSIQRQINSYQVLKTTK